MAQTPTPDYVGFQWLFERFGAGRYLHDRPASAKPSKAKKILSPREKAQRAFRVWLWRNVRDGRFPAPMAIAPNSRAWRLEDVLRWEASLRPVSYAPRQDANA